MGFKALPLSYCSWGAKLTKGIMSFPHILELSKKNNFGEILDNINDYIDHNIAPQDQNNAAIYYDPKSEKFKDEDLEIIPFFIEENNEVITNYIIVPGPLPGSFLPQKLK